MTISSETRKAGPYTGNGSTTSFPFSFKVFTTADVLVVRTNTSGVETTLTLGTDYTVSLNSNQDSNAGGNVVLPTALTSGYLLTIGSKVAYLQQVDLTNQGGFYPSVINAALDKLTIFTQQLKEQLSRSAKLPISSTADADTLSAAILLMANDQENIDAVAGDLTNINAVAANETNIDTVAGISSNVTTVAGISANVTSVAGNATNINAVAGNATNINTVAGNNANVTTVAGISANVTSVAGNSTNINAVAGNATNINAVNSNSTNINTVAGAASAVNTNATNISSINTNASNITAIQNAATNAATATTQAGIATTQATNASTSATNASNSAAAAAASAASGMYSAVQDKSANYTVVAGDAGDLIRVTTTSGAITITLPAISTVSDGFKIAVVKWTSDSNQVTVQRSSSNTINGATSVTIGSQYSQIIFVADFETNTWFASQSGLGATNVNVDQFSGNNSTTAFTLSGDPSTENNTQVFISGIYQEKDTYSVSGTTLTFSTAPPTGTGNIEVVWTTPLSIGTPSDGTVTAAKMAAGAAVGNLGYTPANKAGDTFTGNVTVTKAGDNAQISVQSSYEASLQLVNGGGSEVSVVNAGGSNILSLRTNNIERIRADSSGRVTMPYQPMFSVQRTATNFQSNGVVTFSASPFINVGGHWNTATDTFTAPVSGNYLFILSSLVNGSNKEWAIRKNGTTFVFGYTAVGNWEYTSLSALIPLSAGDTVDAYAWMSGANGLHSGLYTNFSGQLVS